jgi:hypothetical protein
MCGEPEEKKVKIDRIPYRAARDVAYDYLVHTRQTMDPGIDLGSFNFDRFSVFDPAYTDRAATRQVAEIFKAVKDGASKSDLISAWDNVRNKELFIPKKREGNKALNENGDRIFQVYYDNGEQNVVSMAQFILALNHVWKKQNETATS